MSYNLHIALLRPGYQFMIDRDYKLEYIFELISELMQLLVLIYIFYLFSHTEDPRKFDEIGMFVYSY